MAFLELLRRADGTAPQVLEAMLPGSGTGMRRLRRQTIHLVDDPLAHGALIIGPAGSGKSVLARAVALCRYFSVLNADRAREFLQNVRTDAPYRISAQSVPWLEEFSLPGLAESVAEAQLFGFTEDVANSSGAARARREQRPAGGGRLGIFEVAARGHAPIGESRIPEGARATRGVVFLDEIGDLSAQLQPKLLSVLTGARVYRVGGEGREEFGFEFQGLTLAATWRDPHATIRADLRARLSDHVLEIPSLVERMDEFPALCQAILEEVKAQHERWLAQTLGTGDAAYALAQGARAAVPVVGIDRARLQARGKAVATFAATSELIDRLRRVDWQRHSELRGLTQVLRRVVLGASVDEALEVATSSETILAVLPGRRLLDDLLAVATGHRSITKALAAIHKTERLAIVDALHRDRGARDQLAAKLGINREQLKQQIADLKRRSADTPTDDGAAATISDTVENEEP